MNRVRVLLCRVCVAVALAPGFLWPSIVSAAVEVPPEPPARDELSTRVFATIAAGLGSLGGVGLVGATLEVANLRLTGRALLSGTIDFDVTPTEQMEEYAVLLGKSWRNKDRTIYVGGGLAKAKTTRQGEYLGQEEGGFQARKYKELHADTLSVPLEAGITWDGLATSAGVALVANVNDQLEMVGVVLTLSFGKTR